MKLTKTTKQRSLCKTVLLLCLAAMLMLSAVGCTGSGNQGGEAGQPSGSSEGGGTDLPPVNPDSPTPPAEPTSPEGNISAAATLSPSYFKDKLEQYKADYDKNAPNALFSPAFLTAEPGGADGGKFILEGAVAGYPGSSYSYFPFINIVEKVQGGFAEVISCSKFGLNAALIRKDGSELILFSHDSAADEQGGDATLNLYIAKAKKEGGKWTTEVVSEERVPASQYGEYLTESMDYPYEISDEEGYRGIAKVKGLDTGDDYVMYEMYGSDKFFASDILSSEAVKAYDIRQDVAAYLTKNGLMD